MHPDDRAAAAPRQATLLLLGQAGALSGGDVHALRLADALAASPRHDVALIGGADLCELVRDRPVARTTTCLRSPVDRWMRSNTLALCVGLAWRMARATLRAGKSDVIIASSHLLFDVAVAAVASRRRRSLVVVFVYHVIGDMDRPAGWRTSAARMAERMSFVFLRRSRALTFVDNDDAAAAVVRHGIDPMLVRRTENAYDPEPAMLGAAQVPRPSDDPVRMVFVGRLVAQKGIWDVLDVARELRRRNLRHEVVIIGDGPEREALERAISDETLTAVQLRGFVDEKDKWNVLTSSDLFLAPSREEGWGIAVGEALLVGLPVVALNLPAYSHFPVEFDRVDAGRAWVERAVELATDPDERRRRRAEVAAGRDRLPRWSEIVRSDVEIIDAAVEHRAR